MVKCPQDFPILTMNLKIIEQFDSDFSLDPAAQNCLFSLLHSEKFLQQIQSHFPACKLEFTELLFQPVPYSINTPKGMPKAFETYHDNPDYAIVNVPPPFMFEAKIFKPSRLCAVYRLHPLTSA